MIHELKMLPTYFGAVRRGTKTFEVRQNDRPYALGDILNLKEYDPDKGYSGAEIRKRVNYMLADPQYCKEGYVILGLGSAQEVERVTNIELALLLMWAGHGIEEVYKYKHRVKAYHEGRHNTELFLDLTCGAQFPDIPDVANAHPTIPYHDITPEDCKVRVAELIRKRQTLSQTDMQPRAASTLRRLHTEWSAEAEKPEDPMFPAYRSMAIQSVSIIEDIAQELGITIPGINSTEDDQPGTRLMLDGQLCGVCNYVVPLDHAQIGRLEADGTRTPYHMGCEGEAKTIEPCKDCGHHRKFCSECAEPSTEEEETE